jgi:cytochrome c oxidase assembly protein subunit 15
MTEAAIPGNTDRHRLREDPITRWLLLVAALIVLMVVVGGFVRLSRAGLSIVEWDLITGVVPPIGEGAWEEAFADYRLTPEYQLVNEGMTLGEFQRIYLYEWGHRLIARLAGLAVVVPLIWLMARRRLTLRRSLPYWGIAALFAAQGALGWVMVSSGLRDQPRVSEFRLTIHLLTALLLLGIVLWMALNRVTADRDPEPAEPIPSRTLPVARVLLGTIVAQIGLGGLVAGLKAGHVSTTWPLMGGSLVPPGTFSSGSWWLDSLTEPVGAHWLHRWFAMAVLGLTVAVVVQVRRHHRDDPSLHTAATWLIGTIAVQVGLGVWTVLSNVTKWVALAHQANGVIAFSVVLVTVHLLRERTRPAGATEGGKTMGAIRSPV